MSKKYKISIDGKEISIENGKVIVDDGQSWIKEPVYGIESLLIDPKTMDCNVHYSIEKFLGEKKDDNAPAAGKMKIRLFLPSESDVEFADGSKVKNDTKSIFSSPYVKGKIEEFNDYYINEKGYRAFTSKDQESFKIDLTQLLKKIFSSSSKKPFIKWFNGTAIYGYFDYFVKASPNDSEKATVISPYCIAYIREGKDGEKKVFIRRFLLVGLSSKISKGQDKWGSGGKEIGTVK
jgi:hypothetical protein